MTPPEKDAILYAKTGKLDKLKACLDAGVSPNLADDSRVSLLVHAASRGHQPVVVELLVRGADPNFVSGWDDTTALFQARLAGHTAIAELLQQHTNSRKNYDIESPLQNSNPWEGYRALHDAIWNDFQRGRQLNPSENAFLALHPFLTCAVGWGIEDMLRNRGYWTLPDGIRFFDALGEPRYAGILRQADDLIRAHAAQVGYRLEKDPPESFTWDRPVSDALENLSSDLVDITPTEHERLSRKALDFVQKHRSEFTNL